MAAPGPGTLAKFGCVRCREHHLKCDRVTPTCGRCLNAGKTCYPPGLKIRVTTEHKFKFTRKQKWVKTPRRLVFIDESKTVTHDASSPDSGPDESETVCGSPTITSDVSSLQTPSSSSSAGMASFQAGSPPERLRLMMISSVLDPPGLSSSVLDPPAPRWPLENEDQAHLIRHFVKKLAVWLDLCDPNHTFEIIVPQLARDCPVLLYAIFALSARHLGQTRNDGKLKSKFNQLADTYNEFCIKIMKSFLLSSSYQSGWTEHLFAATIILQVMEEMNAGLTDESDDDDDDIDAAKEAAKHGHLPGMYRFVRQQCFKPGTLGAASFWVGLRQEIYSAVTKRQPVHLNLAHPELVDGSIDQTNDYTWANRAVVHCADVLNFCFGSDCHQLGRWGELDEWNRLWLEKLPPSYDPVFIQRQDAAVFPEIWYNRSCQVIGVQHHLLAKLFLLDHRVKRGNPVRGIEKPRVEECIRETTRKICGIGRGNQWTPPGMFTACMAISAFGVYFHNTEEQDAMLSILEQTEREHARPTQRVTEHLLRTWGRHGLLAEGQARRSCSKQQMMKEKS